MARCYAPDVDGLLSRTRAWSRSHRIKTFSSISTAGRPAARRAVINVPLASRTRSRVSEACIDAFLNTTAQQRLVTAAKNEFFRAHQRQPIGRTCISQPSGSGSTPSRVARHPFAAILSG